MSTRWHGLRAVEGERPPAVYHNFGLERIITMADSQFKITCACGEVGYIEIPWRLGSISEFMYGHHGGIEREDADEVTPSTATLTCQCGSSIVLDCTSVAEGTIYEWVVKHERCQVAVVLS